MLTSLTRAWRVCSDEKESTALANRFGPHLARDIGPTMRGLRVSLPALRSCERPLSLWGARSSQAIPP
jgi:hypothetical protein